jgi:hypothetical protein
MPAECDDRISHSVSSLLSTRWLDLPLSREALRRTAEALAEAGQVGCAGKDEGL